MSVTLELSAPVPAHGEMISALELAEPKGVDYREAGVPIRLMPDRGESLQQTDTEAVARLASRLAGVPTSTIGALCAYDWVRLETATLKFFADAHDEALSDDLKVRAPTGNDIRKCGSPFRIGTDETRVFDSKAISALICALTGLKKEEIDALPGKQWLAAMREVLGFFSSRAKPS